MLPRTRRQFCVVKDGVKSLNEPLTARKAVLVVLALAVLTGAFFGGRVAWRRWQARPQSASSVQDQVRSYLKKHASNKDFRSDYDFKLRETAALAQTNFFSKRDELAAFRTNMVKLKAQIDTLKGDEAVAKRAELKTLRDKYTEMENTTAAARRDAGQKQQLLASQQESFAREVKTNVVNAGSYEGIYTWIGRALWTADRLLASSEPADQRSGAMLAEDAAGYAMRHAENYWLAARISEGWLWTNLERFDLPGKPKTGAPQVLQTCLDAFRRAGETHNVVKTYKLELQFANSPRAIDRIRYNLAGALEQAGDIPAALSTYREIQDTNFLKYAQQRITTLERRAAKP
jgi:hypothetical protein